jgi:hypothetical protein
MLLSSVLFTFVFRGVCDEKLFFNKQTLHTSANIIPWTWVETRSFLHLLKKHERKTTAHFEKNQKKERKKENPLQCNLQQNYKKRTITESSLLLA